MARIKVGIPTVKELHEGESEHRYIAGTGLVQYTRYNNQLHSAKMYPTPVPPVVDKKASSQVSNFISISTVTGELDIDFSALSDATIANGDYLMFLDATSGYEVRKEAMDHVANLLAGTVTSTGISNASSVLKLDIQNMTASTTIDDADLVVIDDGAGGTLRKMTRANFIESAALDNINIDGGDISAVTISGGLTWSAAQDLNNQNLTNVDIDSGDIGAVTISGDNTWSADQTGVSSLTLANSKSISLEEDITFTGATGVNLIKFPDNLASSLVFKEGTTAYITLKTTNSSEHIELHKKVLITDELQVGESDGGEDVTMHGSASGNYIQYDSGNDELILTQDTKLMFYDSGDEYIGATSDGNLKINAGTNLLLNSAGTLDINGVTGVDIQENGSNIIRISNTRVISTANTAQIDLDCSGALSLNASGGAINVGNDANAQSINIGTGNAARTITVGHSASTEVEVNAILIDINAGSNGMTINSGGALDAQIAGASTLEFSGALTIDAVDDSMLIDSHTGVEVKSSNSGKVTINGKVGVDIKENGAAVIAIDNDRNVAVGSDEGGYDVTFHSETSGDSFFWDSSDAKLVITGTNATTALDIADGNLVVADTLDVNGTVDADVSTFDVLSTGAFSIDGAAASNITVGSGSTDENLTLSVTGATASSLILSSTGTGADAIDIDTSAGSIDIDSADNITVDAADEIIITTGSADGHISLVSAHTAGVAFHIDADSHAASEVQIDAGILDIDVTGAATIDSSAGSISMNVVDEQTVSIGLNGASETVWTPSATAGTEKWSTIVTSGDTDGADAAGSILLSSVAGGIGLAWNDAMDLWAEGGRFVVTANENPGSAGEVIKLHADAGANQTIVLLNDEGISQSAITLTSTAGGIDLNANAGKDITLNGGQIHLTGTEDAAGAIYLHTVNGTTETIYIHAERGTSAAAATEVGASIQLNSVSGGIGIRSSLDAVNAIRLESDGGTSENIIIHSNQGTSATEGAASIQLLSDVGGINIKSGLNAANAILITADGGTSETIKIHSDRGSTNAGAGAASIQLTSDAGGIELSAGLDIVLEANGNDIIFQESNGDFLKFINSSGSWTMKTFSYDADINIKVMDNNVERTALAIDASDAALLTTYGRLVIGGEGTAPALSSVTDDFPLVIGLAGASLTKGQILRASEADMAVNYSILASAIRTNSDVALLIDTLMAD